MLLEEWDAMFFPSSEDRGKAPASFGQVVSDPNAEEILEYQRKF